MKTLSPLAIMFIHLAGSIFASAQYEGEIEVPEKILEAIRENEERPSNEVTVVLPPPSGADSNPSQESDENPQAEETEAASQDDVVASILGEDADTEIEVAAGEPAPQGPAVRVQPLRDLTGRKISVDDVTINTPFAAKPLGTPSPGWKLISSPQAPRFTQNVEVAPGTWLTLSIRPHVLVPDADGRTAFKIKEPGYNPVQGYRQSATVSASLASSIKQLEADSLTLGQVITDLEQILISLPKSDN